MSMKPILFNTEMVRAILDGRKSCTRRLVKPQPDEKHTYPLGFVTDNTEKKEVGCFGFGVDEYGSSIQYAKPPYQPGDTLYVRETWHKYTKRVGNGESCHLAEFYGYKASIANSEDAEELWKPSIHMPKEAARIWLKVTDVRVKRLQEMWASDVSKEGIYFTKPTTADEMLMAFAKLWNSTIKKSDLDRYCWDANPYVWVIEFERCEKPELLESDEFEADGELEENCDLALLTRHFKKDVDYNSFPNPLPDNYKLDKS